MDTPVDKVFDDYLDDEKIIALALAVQYWGMTNQNPNTSPAKLGTVIDTAQQFRRYLTN